jgi:hypothetical protein
MFNRAVEEMAREIDTQILEELEAQHMEFKHSKEEAEKDPLKAAENHLELCKKMGSTSVGERKLSALVELAEQQQEEVKRLNTCISSSHNRWQEREKELLAKVTGDLNLDEDNVEWVVNTLGELGVKIGKQLFFMYKARSLQYEKDYHIEDGNREVQWRHLYKREFGETCQPPPKTEYSRDRGEMDKDGYYTFGKGWESMP